MIKKRTLEKSDDTEDRSKRRKWIEERSVKEREEKEWRKRSELKRDVKEKEEEKKGKKRR